MPAQTAQIKKPVSPSIPSDLRTQVIFWSLVLLAVLALIHVLGDVLLPFVSGATVAYLLSPLVRHLIGFGLPRKWAALLLLLSFFALVSLFLALAVPFAYRQALQLSTDLPQYAATAQTHAGGWLHTIEQKLHLDFIGNYIDDYKQAVKDNLGKVVQAGGLLAGGLLGGGRMVVSLLEFIVIMPIVAFFTMENWLSITAWVDHMIPRKDYDTIHDLLREIDAKVSGFVRGQIIISAGLGIFYALALTIAGLKYGFLIGLMTGVLSIIPLAGSTIGLVVALTVAWFQTYHFSFVAIIGGIYLVGQFAEGNIITPKVMGHTVGLHPVWILLALMAGGALLGIIGILLAVPIAAVIAVLLAFSIARYKASSIYRGSKDENDGIEVEILDDKQIDDQQPDNQQDDTTNG